jgi:murein DD-endopeptidase MepM/ murein hydrolase activator NlpD
VNSRTLQFLGLIAALSGADAYADDCDHEWICFDAVATGQEVELRAINLQDYPVTYTLRVSTNSMDIEGPSTVTRTLAPQQSQAAMTLNGGGAKAQYRYSYQWTVGDKDAVHDNHYAYALPYAPGKSYRVLQGYGSRFSHTGLEQFAIDFDMPEGTEVHAAREGIVARVEESHTRGCWEDGCGKYANFIVVLHDDGTTGEYYHLEKNGSVVTVGERVTKGQLIGYSGNTGHTTMPHLHFAVYRASEWGNTQSIPVQFDSARGTVFRPRRGGRYEAK